MFKYLMAIVVFAFGTVNVANANPSEQLIDALVKVESNGNPNAIGDNGRAIGILQIWKIVVDDVNRFSNVKYAYDDRYDEVKSREMCKKYLIHYGGKNATNEKYARIWNGGPKGHMKNATLKYWKKVRAKL